MRLCPLALAACVPVVGVDAASTEGEAGVEYAAELGLPVVVSDTLPLHVEPGPVGEAHLRGCDSWATVAPGASPLLVAHEVGHLVGLGHRDVPGALMEPAGPRGDSLTADEVERAHAAAGRLSRCP